MTKYIITTSNNLNYNQLSNDKHDLLNKLLEFTTLDNYKNIGVLIYDQLNINVWYCTFNDDCSYLMNGIGNIFNYIGTP